MVIGLQPGSFRLPSIDPIVRCTRHHITVAATFAHQQYFASNISRLSFIHDDLLPYLLPLISFEYMQVLYRTCLAFRPDTCRGLWCLDSFFGGARGMPGHHVDWNPPPLQEMLGFV